MSLYNLLFGMNPQSDLLLAIVGLRKHDIDRFRDCSIEGAGEEIAVYTRTGGGNREDYPNTAMRKRPEWKSSVDDDFDSTYCTDNLAIPERWRTDALALSDILSNGIRRPFARHLAKTLRREPTDGDKRHERYEREKTELARTQHLMANGHTFVPLNDNAMEVALKLAELADGELVSCFGILPISLKVETNVARYGSFVRAEIGYDFGWSIDLPYWEHCRPLFEEKYPRAVAKVQESVTAHTERRKP